MLKRNNLSIKDIAVEMYKILFSFNMNFCFININWRYSLRSLFTHYTIGFMFKYGDEIMPIAHNIPVCHNFYILTFKKSHVYNI